MTSDIRWFTSEMNGLGQLNNNDGSMIGILNKCLIDGFDQVTLDSLTRSGTTVTATRSTGHPYEVNQVIRIADAVETDYNGDWRITAADVTSFTFEITGSPTTPATGTVTAMAAPVGGWVKEYEDVPANKIVYKTSNVQGSNYKFRIQEDSTLNSNRVVRVQAYSTMTDIDTGALETERSFTKTYQNINTAYPDTGRFVIIADKEYVHFFIHHTAIPHDNEGFYYCVFGFGDIKSYLEGDNHHAAIKGNAEANTNTTTPNSVSNPWHIARAADQITKDKELSQTYSRVNLATVIVISYLGAYNPVNGDVYFDKIYSYESSPRLVRGEVPGFYICSDKRLAGFGVKDIIEGTGSQAGTLLMLIPGGTSTASFTANDTTAVSYAIQINGDWRA